MIGHDLKLSDQVKSVWENHAREKEIKRYSRNKKKTAPTTTKENEIIKECNMPIRNLIILNVCKY